MTRCHPLPHILGGATPRRLPLRQSTLLRLRLRLRLLLLLRLRLRLRQLLLLLLLCMCRLLRGRRHHPR